MSMSNMQIRNASLFLLLICVYETIEQAPAVRRSLIYLDGFGTVPDYSQLSTASITSSTGLWCRGETESTNDVQWILPDGTILSQNNTISSAAVVSLCLKSVGLFAINSKNSLPSTFSSSLLLSGVYTCLVPFKDGHTERYYVWIVKEATPPVFDAPNSDCIISSVDPFQSILTINAGGQVTSGAVTSYTCPGIEMAEFRGINKALSPTRMTVFELFTISTADTQQVVTCYAKNNDGSDALVCKLKSVNISLPTITKASRYSNSTSSAKIEWSPSQSTNNSANLFYRVYARALANSDDSALIPGSIIGDTSAIVRGLTEYKSYEVKVTAFEQQAQARVMPLPVSSQSQIIKPVQCEPAQGYNIDAGLYIQGNEDMCDYISQQNYSNFFTDVVIAIAKQETLQNCTALLEPSLKKFSCNTQQGKTPKQKGTKIGIKAVVFCHSCLPQKLDKRRIHVHHVCSKSKKKTKTRTKTRNTKSKKISSNGSRKISIIVNNLLLAGQLKIKSVQYYCEQVIVNQNNECDCPKECFGR